MAQSPERKLFLGPRLRRMRRDMGLTQTRMAEDLGVSPSYLNYLERNQRPVTAQVLLRLAEAYDIDIRSLSSDQEAADARDLSEVFADPLFRDLAVARHEVGEVAQTRLRSPTPSSACTALTPAGPPRRSRRPVRAEDGGEGLALTPSDWVRDYIQAQRNFFPELDEAGEALAAELKAEPQGFALAGRERLAERHGVQVRVVPAEVLPDSVRRYDHHRRRLMLSEMLGEAGRAFSIAYQLALAERDGALTALVERAAPPDGPTRRLLKVSLANYLAAAAMMPYETFRETCEKTHHDIELIGAKFGASFEQVCHRLTTLSRPTSRGVPFFMLRVDTAGNISKRFAGASFPFSRFGGSCPRGRVHEAFRTPGTGDHPDGRDPRWRALFHLGAHNPAGRRPLCRRRRGAGDRPRLRAEVRPAPDLFPRPRPRRAAGHGDRAGLPGLRTARLPAARRRAARPHPDGRRLHQVDLALSVRTGLIAQRENK